MFLKNLTINLLLATLSLSNAYARPAQNNPPAWVYPGAMYDIDFENARSWSQTGGALYWGTNQSANNPTAAGLVQAADGALAPNVVYQQDKNGLLVSGPADSLRRSGYGVWVEGSVQGGAIDDNYLLNSRDWTQASWTATTMTVGYTSTGADGVASKATRLTATAPAATVLQIVNQPNTVASATVASGGIATYAVGNHLTTVGGTCGTQPVLNVSAVSGGLPTAYTIFASGQCSVEPTNPVATTGGGGTGATANLTFQTYIFDVWMKRVTGTGAVYITANNGSILTQVDSLLNTTSFTQVAIPATTLLGAYTAGVQIASSGDAVDVDFGMLENNDVATMPIVTTGAAVNRAGNVLYLMGDNTNAPNNAGQNINNYINSGHPAAIMIQYSGLYSSLGGTQLYDPAAVDLNITQNKSSAGTIFVITNNGASAQTGNAVTPGLFNLNKVIVSTDGSTNGLNICLNGGTVVTSAAKFSSLVSPITHTAVGNPGGAFGPLNGYYKRITWWPVALDKGKMVQYSTVTNNQ